MNCISLQTQIHAPVERCFDLSRSIEFHIAAARDTQEQAVAGITSGLMGLGDRVKWQARHFGALRTLTVEITQFERPSSFEDAMVEGAFKMMRHRHAFETCGDGTLMTDEFCFQSPFGILGRLADAFVLKRYMRCFLENRNRLLKRAAESDAWQSFIPVIGIEGTSTI